MASLARSVTKPLKVPSLARSVAKPLKVPSLARSVPKPLKVPSLARPVPKPLSIFALDRRATDASLPSLWTPYQLVEVRRFESFPWSLGNYSRKNAI